ncbi:MAG: hypothetical protein IJP75_06325 [Bacteroidaceae bacterium]|nr:hypothetical protein [Bacteroidaceae bacterium]
MKEKHLKMTLALLTICSSMLAQPPHSQVGYDKSSNTLTTLHYSYGNRVESIIYTGQDQTTISVNSNGMPTEITNSLATVSFSYAGTRSVTVTQTVNGQTKTDRLSLDSDKVLSYREEYNRFNQNPSVVDKIDIFLAGGGAKMIGNVLSLVTDKLKNPIGACFEEALKAAKKTDRSIININSLEALNEASNFSVNIGDHAQNALTNVVFNKYGEWTQTWSDMVYNFQMQQYHEQKASNQMEKEWRVSMAATLMANGKTLEEAAQAIAKADQKRRGLQPSKPASGIQMGKGGNRAKNNDEQGNIGTDGDKDKKDDEDNGLPDFDKPDGIISYIKMLANEKHRGLPHTVNVQYNRYTLWDPLAYNFKLNPDKRTYSVEDYSKYAGDAHALGALLEKPFVHLIIWWGAESEEKKIPIPKPVDDRKYKY